MKVLKSSELDQCYNGSYYTIIGAGSDLSEWVEGYNKLLQDAEIGIPLEWVTFKGKEVNKRYNLQDNNRFKDNLTFLAFPLAGLNVGKLAIFKLKMADCWFDDMIDNSVPVEKEEKEETEECW